MKKQPPKPNYEPHMVVDLSGPGRMAGTCAEGAQPAFAGTDKAGIVLGQEICTPGSAPLVIPCTPGLAVFH